jgi:hypothetical protein
LDEIEKQDEKSQKAKIAATNASTGSIQPLHDLSIADPHVS